jgi:hypothetical protein
MEINMASSNVQNQQPQDLFEASNHGSSRDEQMKPVVDSCGQNHGAYVA